MAAAADAFDTGGSTMTFGRIGDLYVVLHPPGDPSPDEWRAALEGGKRELPTLRGIFVFTSGGAPNADQRKRLAEMYSASHGPSLLAVVTSSPTARAIATGINWFLRHPFRLFTPEQMDEAFAHVRASSSEQLTIREILQRHAAWLGSKMRPA